MRMVQGLQLSPRLTQSLVLAPQLQQSLALLQAPTLELKALVEQEFSNNTVLEEVSLARMPEFRTDRSKRRRYQRCHSPNSDPAEPPTDAGI